MKRCGARKGVTAVQMVAGQGLCRNGYLAAVSCSQIEINGHQRMVASSRSPHTPKSHTCAELCIQRYVFNPA